MRRVHFLTFSRSDYASLRPVAIAAERDTSFEVKLIAGGSHLLERFGSTIEGIREDGFRRIEVIDFLTEGDNTDVDIANAYGRAVSALIDSLTADRPDFVFIVGDRWEMLAVATVASLLRIPVAHHSGGDVTQGSADNQTRYVLTTLSHLHFVALEHHRERLIAMGEEPWRISVVGEPALTQIAAGEVPDHLWSDLGLQEDEHFVLATFHPTSYAEESPETQVDVFIETLARLEHAIVLTAPNPDAGSGSMYERLADFARRTPRVHLFESLGSALYYGAMSRAEFMIGNSSSGLWEAPSFALPAVNIGPRQSGRTRGDNVVDADLDLASIESAIAKISKPEFRASLHPSDNPYVRPNTIESILAGLNTEWTRDQLLAKVLVDPLGMIPS